jgi:hypothetical protein
MKFDTLFEAIKNPLRKQSLVGVKPVRGDFEGKAAEWKEYILNGDLTNDPIHSKVRDQYLQFKRTFPDRADAWLNQRAQEYENSYKREKTSEYRKIFEHQGIQVFLDQYAHVNFPSNPENMRKLKSSLIQMLNDTRDIIPNRKPRFVITNGVKNPKFKNSYTHNPPAIYTDRIIFIDENEIDQHNLFTHEFAHFAADLIPKQTQPLLEQAYKELLDLYWKRAKVKKRNLLGDTSDDFKNAEAEKYRKIISKKLGFPQYGLQNFDEFFAVLIENWKKLPNNSNTYKFKSLVKGVLSRL